MINFSVINLRNLIKNIFKISIFFILIIGIMNLGDLIFNESKKFSFLELAETSLGFTNIKENTSLSNNNFLQKIISSELPLLSAQNSIDLNSNKIEETQSNSINTLDYTLTKNEQIINSNTTIEESITENTDTNINSATTIDSSIFANLQTEIVSENNLSENFNITYGNVKIKNETNYYLSDNILEPNVSYNNKTDILIFHTHTCESYTQTEANSYIASGNYRTTDLNHSVAQVGTILSNELSKYNYNVIHSLEYHDYPAYNGSYSRSLNTVCNLLKQNSPELVIDLHRDAIGSMSNYAPAVKIGDETVAQLMFVIGTNGGGLKHDNWQNNLKYAVKIQQKANELFPGLFRPILVRNSRYNQHLTSSSCIIEVGATGNTLEQATR